MNVKEIKKLKFVLKGVGTYLPSYIAGFLPGHQRQFSGRGKGKTAPSPAREAYVNWMRHLVLARDSGLSTNPSVVAEFGPGGSLGAGLAALLCGAKEYYAFDVVRSAGDVDRNLEVLDGLVELLRSREDIPDNIEFPKSRPYLDSYVFPKDILTESRLKKSLNPRRINSVREALTSSDYTSGGDVVIRYLVPWDRPEVIKEAQGKTDILFSQATMEHVDNPGYAYKVFHSLLKPKGFISHQIDFKSHDTSDIWNGHWTYSDAVWRLVRGRGVYFINREPHSSHLKLMEESGFKIACDKVSTRPSDISRKELSSRFRSIGDSDLKTSEAHILAVKIYA